MPPFEPNVRQATRTRDEEEGRPFGATHGSRPDLFFQELKTRIHRKLIDTIDLTRLSNLEMEMVKVEIRHTGRACPP